MSKRNRYSKALKHLKSTQIEEKIRCLDEALPTNHTKGLYSLNPPGFRVGRPDPIKTFYPDSDGNWPSGIPGTEGELTYDRPAGFWSGERNWDHITISNMSQDYLVDDPDGKSTAGVIAADGTVLAGLPPGGESFILGPLVDGWTRNHVYDAFTQIGYIQKDTRQFVALGRIEGQWKVDLHGSGYAVWDGTSTGFTSYNENFTLAMAQWARQQIIDNNYVDNIPYFYSGGTPQQPLGGDTCPNCPEGSYGGHGFAPLNPADFGSGGDSDDITIGTDQPPPESGDATDAGYPAWGGLKDGIGDFIDNIFGSGTSDGIDDLIDGISDNIDDVKDGIDDFIDGITDAFGDNIVIPLSDALGSLTGGTGTGDSGGTGTDAGAGRGGYGGSAPPPPETKKDTTKEPEAPESLPGGDLAPILGGLKILNSALTKVTNVTNPVKDVLGSIMPSKIIADTLTDRSIGGSTSSSYNGQLGMQLLNSVITGNNGQIKLSKQGVKNMFDSIDPSKISDAITLGPKPNPDAQNAIKPGQKVGNVLTKGWGDQGGSEFNYDKKTGLVTITSNKMLRSSEFDKKDDSGKVVEFEDIPTPTTDQIWQHIPKNVLKTFYNTVANAEIGSSTDSQKFKPFAAGKDPKVAAGEMLDAFPEITKALYNFTVHGTASNAVWLRQQMVDAGISPQSESEKQGEGFGGHVYSQESMPLSELKPEVQAAIKNKLGIKESFRFGRLRKVKFITETASAAPTSTASTPTDTSTSTESSSSDLKPIADSIAGKIVDKKGPEVANKVEDGLKDYAKENDIPLDQEYQTPEQRKIETDKLYPNVAKIGNQTHFDNPEYVKAMVEYEKWNNPKIRAEYERKNDWLKKNFTVGPENSTYKWVTNYHRKFVAANKELRFQYKHATYGDSKPKETKPEETKPEETKPWWDRDDGEGKLSDTDYASAAAATAERKKKKDFEARMAALDAEIAGYDAAVKAAHAEMRNIVIQFGIDAALTIFGGALLKGGVSAIKALRGYSALSKAQKSAKTAKALSDLGKGASKGKYKMYPQPKQTGKSGISKGRGMGDRWKGESYEPQGRVITESSFTPRQRKILREIKNPIEIKEAPKKYKMNFAGKYSSQNTPDKTASAVSDALVASGNARGQRWRTEDKYWQGYETTERMNIIYDRLGHGSMAWDRTIAEAQRKNGWRTREIQEQLNICAHEKAMRNIDPDYQSPWSIEIVETTDENEKRFDKVNKIKQVVSQGTNKRIAAGQRNVAPEYPDQAPPEMVNGWHPKLATGQDISNRYNKLDPQSAEAMPKTGNPHIDSKVEKAKKRFPKGKSNKPYLESRNFFSKRFKEYRLQEQLVNWTGGVYTQLQGPTGPVDVSSFDGGEEATYSDFTQGSTTHNSLQSVELAPRGAGTNASDGFSIGPESGNAYLGFDGQTMVGEDRVAILDPIDATKLDTIMIQVIVGNNSNGGTTPTYASDGAGLGLEWYPPNGYALFPGGSVEDALCPWYAGVDEDDVMVTYDADTDDQKGYVVTSSNASSSLKTYTVTIPPHLRRANLAIGIKQYGEWNSEEKELNYGVSRISYQNRTISSVQSGISLDTPGASAFIRVGQGTRKTDPKKRRKEVFEKLQASRKYTDKQFGEDFPGSGAQLVGDDEITPSPTTSQQVRDAWSGEPGERAPSTSQRVRDLLDKDVLTTPELEQLVRLSGPAPKLPFEGPAPAGYQAKADRQWSSLNNVKKQTLAFFEKAAGSGVRGLFAVAAAADNAPNFGAMSNAQFHDFFSQAIFGSPAGTPLEDPSSVMYSPSFSTSPGGAAEPWSMDIQVGDERIVKKGQGQSGTTVLDTQRGIDNTKPQTVPSDSYVAGVDYKQPSASDRGELTKTDTATVRPKERDKKSDTGYVNPNIVSRALRSFTDQTRYAGDTMWQGGPSTRPPGVSNYWSPDPTTAAGYSNPGGGYPGARPNPSGTLAQAPRPANTPRVTRSPAGQPQFKFPRGTTVDNFVASAADDVATAAAQKVAAKSASKLGRIVPGVAITLAVADVTTRMNNGDYLGAALGGLSAVPGPLGWTGLGLQVAGDLTGMTGGDYRESYSSYEEYLNFAKTEFKKIKAPEDPRGYVRALLELIKDNKDLTDDDKIILTLVLSGDTRGLEAQDLQKVIVHLFNLSKQSKGKDSLKESRLKNPKQFFNPDDIKPEFPNEPPPEMINGYHPHLVDGQEISNRYNKLDPTSAKAMPKTGNPHIDAKVEKAKNNPDKDGPKWRKMVDAKARKARLQRG